MTILTTENFEESIKEGPVVVDFFATWCGPCNAIAPIMEDLSKEYEGKAKIFKVDVDQAPQIAAKFEVMSIPTIILFKDGEIQNTMMGAQPAARFKEEIDKLL
ncbi:MAG: thioredoxin [bacterium]